MKTFQSGRHTSRRKEIERRRRWNTSMWLSVRSCGKASQSFIRSQIDQNKALIAELEWQIEQDRLFLQPRVV